MKIKNLLAAIGAGVIISWPLFISNDCYGSEFAYRCEEICDGEVIMIEPLDYTYYIYPDREFDDLANKKKRTTEDMNKLIDHVLTLHPDSVFKGQGQAFICASNETGLDPIFFFALSGIESAWGTNETHVKLNNPYSIGMYNDGSYHGWDMGDTFGKAIIEGARFIYDSYYKNGQTTLYLMNHDPSGNRHCYCAGDTNWEYQIASEMSYLESLLED